MRILLVEDNTVHEQLFVGFASKLANGLAWTIDTVDSLAGAEERLKADDYDVLVVDLRLTDSTPSQTISWLSRQTMPRVVFTNHSDRDTVQRCMKAGVTHFLPKQGISLHSVQQAMLAAQYSAQMQEMEVLSQEADKISPMD